MKYELIEAPIRISRPTVSIHQEPFFTRGPSPLARLTFFAVLSIVIMIADHRFRVLPLLRLGVSMVLDPIEQTLAMPGAAARRLGDYLTDQKTLIEQNRNLQNQVLALAEQSQRAQLILAEKNHTERLQADQPNGIVAEIIRDARNPFARKIIINRGRSQGVTPGQIVIDGSGVVGQITAVGLLSAEVTLTTEKDQSAPVMVLRNGLRAIAVGTGREGTIDIPFIPVAADIQVGDTLVTSGIDGSYPMGLSVATV
ncbi:MAG: rod shape-determining protein MreC, partial [Betaproteobacteria bacterium]|nr:rod shape-determining protein MreC [Betaproteobacteria bacterium]